jgi:ring-1,2-phenylacetyl-CoA epoxidase subunit PaaC
MRVSFDYVLHLADNAVILGQRNAEWSGHGPILEEDIAMSNITLDLIGQARLLYQLAARLKGGDVTEDTLAYFRGAHEFRNYTLLELPHHAALVGYAQERLDFGTTIVRNFLYSALMVLVWDALKNSANTDLAAIAEKSVKEVRYHLQHSRDWLLKLGDGTEESHRRTQAALNHLFAYTQEFWTDSAVEKAALQAGVGVDLAALKPTWDQIIDEALAEANLQKPATGGYVTEGKHGIHSEHLGFLLAEMQSLARAIPDGTW